MPLLPTEADPDPKEEMEALDDDLVAWDLCDARRARRPDLIAAFRSVQDPEISYSLYELGLIYAASWHLEPEDRLVIEFTVTSPFCPVTDRLTQDLKQALKTHDVMAEVVDLRLVWEPPWSLERVPFSTRLNLGLL